MKNSKLLKFSILTLLPVIMAVGVISTNSGRNVVETEAYTGASLPTTINLNDCDETSIRSYYSGLNSLGDSEKKGNNLLKNLKTILKDGQKYYNYDSGDLVWKMYEITDRDWEKSPASALKGITFPSITISVSLTSIFILSLPFFIFQIHLYDLTNLLMQIIDYSPCHVLCI